MPEDRTTRWRRHLLRMLVSMGVSFLILAFLLRLFTTDVGASERPQLLVLLRNTSLALLACYAGTALLQAFVRAVRYRILIAADGESRVPGLFHSALVSAVRNMLVDLLPARLGELSYIGMMNVGCKVSGRACVSSLAVSFAFDFVALFFIIAGVLAHQALTAALEGWLAWAAVVILAACVVMLVLLFAAIRPAIRLARKLLGALGRRKPLATVLAFGEDVAEAIERARRGRVLGKVFLLSLIVRLTKYTGLYLLFRAVVVPSFSELANAPLPGVMTSFLCAEGMASLPVPSFMSFGTYEAGGSLAFTLLGFAKAQALIAMLAIHLWSQVVDYGLGGLAFALFLFRKRDGAAETQRPRRAPLLRIAVAAGALAVLTGGLVLAAWQYRKTRKLGALTPPEQGHAVERSKTAVQQDRTALADLKGFVVWSSNRHGNHDILIMSLPGRGIRQLTRHPHVDYFPRIAPDGKHVVFARSQQPWVSQRNCRPWDVYTVNVETGAEALVARNGNTPTWSHDGQAIIFQRNACELVAYDTGSRRETVLCSSESCGLPDGTELQTPSYNRLTGTLAVTLRGPRREAVVGQPGEKLKRVSGGCQLTWGHGGGYLYCIDKGGRQRNAVYRVAYPSLDRALWIDLPGDYSHEYFPKASRDGRYLVLGACAKGHEHDSADYEIFLWPVGAPPEQAVRLTWHSGNDCWPDIHVE
jgi:hypothetical protein